MKVSLAMIRLSSDSRVDTLDDERAIGNGILITLRQGWSFDPLQDNRVAGADTINEARSLLARAQEFKGPYHD